METNEIHAEGDSRRMKKALIVINPVAGDGTALRLFPSLIRGLTEKGYICTAVTTTRKGSATEYALDMGAEHDLIVCSGGDGTANEVIRGLMQLPEEKRPTFGFIPCGSTNDFATTLGIPKTFPKAVSMIMDEQCIPVDVGKFNDRYYAYVCAFGAFTNLSYDTPQSAKNWFGLFAYVAKGLEQLNDIKPIHMRFEINGEIIDDDFAFGCISNSHIIGGVIRLDKNWVELNDGMFEITLIRYPEDSYGFTRIFTELTSGEMNCEYINIYHAKEVDITVFGEPIAFSLDGEPENGVSHAHIENIHSGINCIVHKKEKPQRVLPPTKSQIKKAERFSAAKQFE
ncbi:MAG: YegS/Rv2252/BmrU family lipid kinase [Clostridia bacterium]|nr:YegS/Rv2252/BmrU family lipid kinase [Clostridia bacterium]